jgi:hypothetical protein
MKRAVIWLQNAWKKPDRARQVGFSYGAVFDTPQGKAVISDLAKYCNVATTSFVPGDPYQTALNEGRRDAFNHIAEMLGLTPADFPNLVKEQTND